MLVCVDGEKADDDDDARQHDSWSLQSSHGQCSHAQSNTQRSAGPGASRIAGIRKTSLLHYKETETLCKWIKQGNSSREKNLVGGPQAGSVSEHAPFASVLPTLFIYRGHVTKLLCSTTFTIITQRIAPIRESVLQSSCIIHD